MKKITVSYAQFYNSKYKHVGHVFQNRYFSDGIESERRYINVIRYILRNPEKSGLGKMEKYKWSSYGEFFPKTFRKKDHENDTLTDIETVLAFFGGREVMHNTLTMYDNVEEYDVYENSSKKRYTDEQIAEELKSLFHLKSCGDIRDMDKKERNKILRFMKEKGVTVRQLSRVTGIGRSIVQRA